MPTFTLSGAETEGVRRWIIKSRLGESFCCGMCDDVHKQKAEQEADRLFPLPKLVEMVTVPKEWTYGGGDVHWLWIGDTIIERRAYRRAKRYEMRLDDIVLSCALKSKENGGIISVRGVTEQVPVTDPRAIAYKAYLAVKK